MKGGDVKDTGTFREAVQSVLNADSCAEHYYRTGDFVACAEQQQQLGRSLLRLRAIVEDEIAEVRLEVPLEGSP